MKGYEDSFVFHFKGTVKKAFKQGGKNKINVPKMFQIPWKLVKDVLFVFFIFGFVINYNCYELL